MRKFNPPDDFGAKVPNRGNLNIPRLRFPEFTEEWETKRLGEIATFSKGKGISKSDIEENGITECIRYGELYTHYGEVINKIKSKTNVNTSTLVLSETNDVIIPASGETTIDIATASCVMKSGVALGGDLNIIKTDNNGVFLSYYLNSKKKMEIANLAQGISVVHLYSSQLAILLLNFPKLEEQNRISNFVAKLDARIITQNKIIRELKVLKTAISKRIFSRELRFKDDKRDDFIEWKNMTLGDIGEVKMCRRIFNDETSTTGEIPFFKIGSFGKEADAFISKKLYIDYRKKFSFPKKGDILISAAGTIGRTVVYKGEEAYYQDSNIVWIDNNETKVNNEFLYYILQIVKYNTEGGTIQRLYNNILKSTKFSCPSLPEQTKIADFLSGIDQKIQTEKAILTQLEKQKKYLLQQMFI